MQSFELRSFGKPVEMDRLEGRPLSKYSLNPNKWKEGDILCVDACDPHPLMKRRWGQELWVEYGSARCIDLREEEDGEGKNNFLGPILHGNDRGSCEVFES
jgi:hypothetical protein